MENDTIKFTIDELVTVIDNKYPQKYFMLLTLILTLKFTSFLQLLIVRS